MSISFFYLWAAGTVLRSKYYVAWKLAEAALISSGANFNGYDNKGKPKWYASLFADCFTYILIS